MIKIEVIGQLFKDKEMLYSQGRLDIDGWTRFSISTRVWLAIEGSVTSNNEIASDSYCFQMNSEQISPTSFDKGVGWSISLSDLTTG